MIMIIFKFTVVTNRMEMGKRKAKEKEKKGRKRGGVKLKKNLAKVGQLT